YARRHRQFISNYRKAKALDGEIILSSSESEVLRAMYKGLTRPEIADNLKMHIGTVKLIINNIYEKLNARDTADVIRIAAVRKLV
ncbi:MAG: helix-turn-helix transcriptional regulator, partial [Synergistaceae bacterium]|nr:helix-turn-helix transcriptional regulator [Synergistaceae bacterium]